MSVCACARSHVCACVGRGTGSMCTCLHKDRPTQRLLWKQKWLLLPGHPSRCRFVCNRTTQFSTVHSGVGLSLIYHPQPIPADPPFSLNSELQNQNQGQLRSRSKSMRSPQSPGSPTLQSLWNSTCLDVLISVYLILAQNFISYHGIFSGKVLLISILLPPLQKKKEEEVVTKYF